MDTNNLKELGELLARLNGGLLNNQCCDVKNALPEIKGAFKHEKYEFDYTSAQNNGFIDAELKAMLPKKPSVKCCDFLLVVLILCLFVPFVLLFLGLRIGFGNNAVLDSGKTTTSLVVSIDSTNNIAIGSNMDVENTIQKLKDDAHLKYDKKENSVAENKQKESCCKEVLFGICAIVLSIAFFCLIVFYLKFLQKRQEQECQVKDSYFEFSKRVYSELLQIKTAPIVLYNQAIEQGIEMQKKSELIRFDEIQKYFEFIRQCKFKEIDLNEKYLKEATSVINKYYETQRVDRKERDIKLDVSSQVNLDQLNLDFK